MATKANAINEATTGIVGFTGTAFTGSPASSTDRAIVTWNGTAGTTLFDNSTATIDSTGRMKNTAQPSFLAYLSSSTANNVTGDATIYTLICDTETTDVGGNYNNTTGTFTAPVTGNYLLTFTADFANLSAGHTNNQIRIITTAATFLGSLFGFTAAGVGGIYCTSMSVICPMTATDTATFVALAAGSTKTVGFAGGASPRTTYVSGMLVS